MYFYPNHSFLPPLPRSDPSFLHTQLWVLFFVFQPIKSSLFYSHTLGYVSHYHTVHLPGTTPLKKTYSPSPNSYKLPIALIEGCDFLPTFPLYFGFYLAWVCTSLLHDVTTIVNSYVQLFGCVQKTLLPCSHLSPLTLKIFLLSLLQWSLRPGWGECGKDVPFRAEHL